jgi:hypothetical protein
VGTHYRGYSVGGKGVYNAICEVCRGKYKNYELRQRWDGLMVCEEDYETRHILDFYKPPRDNYPIPFVRKDGTEYGQVYAVLSSNIASPTLGSWTLLPLATELADQLSEFNTGTSTFQPSVAATYALEAGLKADLAPRGRARIRILKNGAQVAVSDFNESPNIATVYLRVLTSQSLLNTDLITVQYWVEGSLSQISSANEATFLNVRISN